MYCSKCGEKQSNDAITCKCGNIVRANLETIKPYHRMAQEYYKKYEKNKNSSTVYWFLTLAGVIATILIFISDMGFFAKILCVLISGSLAFFFFLTVSVYNRTADHYKNKYEKFSTMTDEG
ncbi:hypothetical protein [Bacteroides sp. 519]|uniref:hypothetical protein n=1 Tax=Bacteroides sp. 519 TaxID=2302937 RepID=UPI0013D3295B|nr:hypothetical protein [Bacteroides sp. 519]NDV59081.1 hypothetical protein [Bacteroides sp. 519]